MTNKEKWPFKKNSTVTGMRLPDYLSWSAGTKEGCHKDLLLPPIQRGFVWKPVQIAQLWDSLLRGMPIGSLMVSMLAENEKATRIGVKDREVQKVSKPAIGLLDGQQRTLAMLLGWSNAPESDHCVWVDLEENGQSGSPFELRISTRTQPFGYQRHTHVKLSRHDRSKAREFYDKKNENDKTKSDYELFDPKAGNIRPWKAGKSNELCFPIRALWDAFRINNTKGLTEFVNQQLSGSDKKEIEFQEKQLDKLKTAFERLELLEVPLILVPQHISQPPSEIPEDAPAPLTLLFERIARNGASLRPEDLLFSMIKQQWPEAHDLVAKLHSEKKATKIAYLMSPTDCVMTAYRLAMAEEKENDTPDPSPRDFHRHLGQLIQEQNGKKTGPLRLYLQEESKLVDAFKSLYDTLKYRETEDGDIGLPDLMLPHLSRSLMQVLLRWFMLNPGAVSNENRNNVIAFTLFWYLCIWHDNNASKEAFKAMKADIFPSSQLYKSLIEGSTKDEIKLAMPFICPERLETILIRENYEIFRKKETIFKKNAYGTFEATYPERELFKRFCWWRKPVLLWLQRKYVEKSYSMVEQFAGLTDEDTVPYDYDHLCPQNHWGADWRNIIVNLSDEIKNSFNHGRSDVGNCIGNLHVLDSSLNRSFGDCSLKEKISYKPNKPNEHNWDPQKDSLIHNVELWSCASPNLSAEKTNKHHWDIDRLKAFQQAVQERTLLMYGQYYKACRNLMEPA